MESTTASVAPRAYAGGWRRLLGFAIVLGGLAVLCAQRAGNDPKAANYDKYTKMAEDNFKQAIDAAEAGTPLEIVSPERFFAPEMGGLNLVPYMRALTDKGVTITTMTRVRTLAREGNRIRATLWSPYTQADSGSRIVDQVVVENGTSPLADLYFDLKELSSNRGEVDHMALINGRPQSIVSNSQGRFQLFRIGDAVAARNVHAGMYDAVRLVKDL